uniref:BCAS3 domain-containing protein n=1 Tax=Panagrolaimus sp. JU765 TaxID=591449 RepID=A0AC34QHD9_9BILA
MSICNGSKKRSNKKNAPLSTAAVYPIIQNIQKEDSDDLNDNLASINTNGCKSNQKSQIKSFYGQKVEPQSVPEPTIASSVADLVHEVVPQGQAPHTSQNEAIQWVNFQKCEYWRGTIPQVGYMLIIGLARGYQIWWLDDNGNCLEVVSERKGPLKFGTLLPFLIDNVDNFRETRPLFAKVDGNPLIPENKLSTISIISLRTGKEVHELSYTENVVDLKSSAKALVVALNESLIVYHPGTFHECLTIPVCPSLDLSYSTNFAISDCFLAYADKTLNKQVQSVGGVVLTEDPSYSGQLFNAAKSVTKTISSIGESLVTSFTANQNKQLNSNLDIGIVTIIDLNVVLQDDFKPGQTNKHISAHFVAHEGQIGYLTFGNGGQLLLTSSQSATNFRIFAFHPHPGLSALGCVQHLYTLCRGNTTAKVINCAFSDDNRWVAISTNHGTTHLFTISPYGGPISLRTHGGKLVNKESRFERTAGLVSDHVTRSINHHTSTKPGQPAFGASQYYKEHAAINHCPLYKTTINPRLNLNVIPVSLYSVAKLRARVFSAEDFSAWASDNTPVSISSSSKTNRMSGQGWSTDSSRKISTCFTRHLGDVSYPDGAVTLCVLNADGVLTSYLVQTRQERHNSTGSTSSMNIGDPLSSSPSPSGSAPIAKTINNEVNIIVKPMAVNQWFLHRSRNASSIEPPLAPSNTILLLYNLRQTNQVKENKKDVGENWLRNVEVDTYSGPSRRLWTGPQFAFGMYTTTGHSSAQLFTPNDTHSINTFITAQKCCPVLIEKNSAYPIMGNEFSNNSQIVCGSWSSDFERGFPDPTIKEKIEDAMKDLDPIEINVSRVDKSFITRDRNMSSNSSSNAVDLLSLSGIDL